MISGPRCVCAAPRAWLRGTEVMGVPVQPMGVTGMITLNGGSGTMAPYNMGDFGVSRDQVRVNSALPDISTAQQILIGGSFVN